MSLAEQKSHRALLLHLPALRASRTSVNKQDQRICQNGLEYAGRLLHGAYQRFESPRLHDLREVLLSGTHHNTENGRLPYDLGAFDLDGTVLRRDLTITEATVDALRELRERGMRLVVATGRRFEGAQPWNYD